MMDNHERFTMSSPEDAPFLKLEPLVHQVGGHSSMLCLGQSMVCKPLISREKLFYDHLPEALRPFTAKYLSTISVSCVEDTEGYLKLTAFPPEWYIETPVQHARYRIKMHNGGCLEIESKESDEVFEDDTSVTSTCIHQVERRPSSSHNPWVLRCHMEHLSKVFGISSTLGELKLPQLNEFLLLENLTLNCRRPCVLDLKMGTRQYGDDASESKRQSQSVKVVQSTSGSLGIRLCGMQVFQVTTNRYLCRNKYFGRALTDQGIRQSFQQFFHNGSRLRKELLPVLIRKLQLLREIVEQLDSFRFFTSSLLVIYDGIEPPANGHSCTDVKDIDVRIIDFAHATHSKLPGGQSYQGPDDGFLFGLGNLVTLLEELLVSSGTEDREN